MRSPEQLRYGKDNGAVGVFMRGYESNRRLTDGYFDPLYEACVENDLPITVHAGCGNPAFVELTDGDAFARNKLPVISSFHSLIFKRVPQRFPGLRFGFVEVAANWVPYVHQRPLPPRGAGRVDAWATTCSATTGCTWPARRTTTSRTSSSTPPRTTL